VWFVPRYISRVVSENQLGEVKSCWLVSQSVIQSRVAENEAGDSLGTQRKENVRRWKPLPGGWWRHSRLRRLKPVL
jgi:hypothetical protein